jgi:hypothetical protein
MEELRLVNRSGAPLVTAARRFHLLDAMILVAATAFGCALVQ